MQKKDLIETWKSKRTSKTKFAALTDTDVLIIARREMITKIQVKCGKTRQDTQNY
jgi:hypothetical protein